MDRNDQQAIEELFRKLRDVEQRNPQRDREAEALIREMIARQPAAAYYMAQTIVAQEQALIAARERLEQNEKRGSGGFLSDIFGGGGRGGRAAAGPDWRDGERRQLSAPGPWSGRPSFLGGAMQTALGVAGGVVLGNFLADLLMPDAAHAADTSHDAGQHEGMTQDEPGAAEHDAQGDEDFGGGDFSGGDL
jgi:uncharacterized protein